MFRFLFSKKNRETTDSPPNPQKKLTEQPWRKNVRWNTEFEQSLEREIKELSPEGKHNLLMSGPVGVGKSSFICSVLSVERGRRFGMSITGDTADTSMTLELLKYGDGDLLKGYRIYDCMGIEPDVGNGMHEDDFMLLLGGHIKKDYTFNPVKPITTESKWYRSQPNAFDHMHCVIFVASAPSVYAGISPAYIQKIKPLQNKIKRKRIPRILILTKVEQVCDEVEEDITKMYRSLKIKEIVEMASEVFAIERASIHPVKNYENEGDINAAANIPLLLALKQAKQYAIDRVEYLMKTDSESDDN